MMKPLQPLAPWKRIANVGFGLVFMAGAIFLFLRPSGPVPDPSGNRPTAAPTGQPAASASATAPAAPDKASPSALLGSALADYDSRLSDLAQAVRPAPAAATAAPAILESANPMDQVSGLARMAGLGQLDNQRNVAQYPPEVVLAAVDLAAARFGETAARSLLDRWTADMGGAKTAAELAHNLLLEARLPYGGGSAALDLMVGVNDPSAIFVGLYEFAMDSRLPGSIRTEALLRLQDQTDSETYRKCVRDCAEWAQENGDEWALRAARLQDRLDASAVNAALVAEALAQPYPGMVEDLELQLRQALLAGRVEMDPETAASFRAALANLDESTLSGPDEIALLRLRREIDAGLTGD